MTGSSRLWGAPSDEAGMPEDVWECAGFRFFGFIGSLVFIGFRVYAVYRVYKVYRVYRV